MQYDMAHFSNNDGKYFDYQALGRDFIIETNHFQENQFLKIDERSSSTSISLNQVYILHLKEKKRKRFNYITTVVDHSSISLELWTNEQDDIEICYADFRVYGMDDKMEGFYALRIRPQNVHDRVSISFISSRGEVSEVHFQDIENSISKIVPAKPTTGFLDGFIKQLIPILNSRTENYNIQPVSVPTEFVISKLMGIELEVISFLKQMKQELPFSLQERLERFIRENDKSQHKNKQVVL